MHDAADCSARLPPPDEHFAERACRLVAFLVHQARDGPRNVRGCEEALAEWIWRWQQAAPAAHHFVANELDIILRALHGPDVPRPPEHADCKQLCRVIVACLSSPPPAGARHRKGSFSSRAEKLKARGKPVST